MECAHHLCTCLVTDGDQFCSESCRSGVEGAEICLCGHQGCVGTQL